MHKILGARSQEPGARSHLSTPRPGVRTGSGSARPCRARALVHQCSRHVARSAPRRQRTAWRPDLRSHRNERIPLNEDTVWAGPRSGGPTPPASGPGRRPGTEQDQDETQRLGTMRAGCARTERFPVFCPEPAIDKPLLTGLPPQLAAPVLATVPAWALRGNIHRDQPSA